MSSEWRDKDRTKDAPWSEYVWDSRGCWVTSRRNEEGEWGHEYSYPETVATPSQDPTQALSEDHQPGSTTSNSYRTADENGSYNSLPWLEVVTDTLSSSYAVDRELRTTNRLRRLGKGFSIPNRTIYLLLEFGSISHERYCHHRIFSH
jgi:hypothetical protein